MRLLATAALIVALSATADDAIADRTWSALLQATDLTQPIAEEQVRDLRQSLWRKYLSHLTADPGRLKEHQERRIDYDGKSMHFHYEVVGSPVDGPLPLYIALHGGGGGPARMNDGQYQHMQRYYLPTVKRGIYCATRGVSNTYDLHYRPASYVCYDRLIENMIAFENVDPNRVYVMGFSAGGDGVYQIAPRMADRWAAAAMSAGHHNGASPRNLYQLPLLLQVGERDTAWDRLAQSVIYFQRIQKLRDFEGSGYKSDLFVHAGRGHNFADNHPQQAPQKIFADPVAWRRDGDTKTASRNTSSIAWLDQHVRTPQPNRVIWDRNTGADRTAAGFQQPPTRGQQHYWLDTSDMAIGPEEIIVRLVPADNRIVIERLGDGVRFLLNDDMLDLDKPVKVSLDGITREIKPPRTLANLVRTLAQRGDPSHAYPTAIEARRGPGVLILK